MDDTEYIFKKKGLVIAIQLVLVIFLLLGAELDNAKLRILYFSYCADIAIFFGYYFLVLA